MSELSSVKLPLLPISDPEPEDEVFPGVTMEDLGVMVVLLSETVGGKPGIGYNQHTLTWVLAPSCLCEDCKAFTEQYQMVAASNPLRAIKLYVEAWNAYERLLNPTTILH